MSTSDKSAEAQDDPAIERHGHRPPSFWVLTLGSIGVVYGDIGTSPFYALREAVLAAMRKDGAISEPMIYGVLSLILWAPPYQRRRRAIAIRARGLCFEGR